MKVLVTGCKGQVGIELIRQGITTHEVVAFDHAGLDITDANAVHAVVQQVRPDVVINAAAYTAVDRAEEEVELAFAVNRDGPKNLAKACSAINIPMVHISTDYVFDGSKQGAYTEEDPIAPLGVYGASKAAGEAAVRAHCPHHLILRTSWVFSAHGNNFVKTMLRLGAERKEISVVADQWGCPTAASELARGIYAAIGKKLNADTYGTYNFCQPQKTSWHGFAEAVFSEARRQGWKLEILSVKAISTAEFPTLAKRPINSVLDCDRFESSFNQAIRSWSESLHDVINELYVDYDDNNSKNNAQACHS